MIEFIYSKLTVVIVACILIAFFVMFFQWQDDNVNIMELENILDEVSDQINTVSLQDAGTSQNITFDRYADHGLKLPPSIDDEAYNLTIYDNAVYADWKGASFSSQFAPSIDPYEVHFWEPEYDNYTRSEILENDQILFVEIPSGQDFVIERKLIEVSAHLEYHTFIYIMVEE